MTPYEPSCSMFNCPSGMTRAVKEPPPELMLADALFRAIGRLRDFPQQKGPMTSQFSPTGRRSRFSEDTTIMFFINSRVGFVKQGDHFSNAFSGCYTAEFTNAWPVTIDSLAFLQSTIPTVPTNLQNSSRKNREQRAVAGYQSVAKPFHTIADTLAFFAADFADFSNRLAMRSASNRVNGLKTRLTSTVIRIVS